MISYSISLVPASALPDSVGAVADSRRYRDNSSWNGRKTERPPGEVFDDEGARVIQERAHIVIADGASPTEVNAGASSLRSPASVRAICTQIISPAVRPASPGESLEQRTAWWRSGAESVGSSLKASLEPFGSSSVNARLTGRHARACA